MMFSKAMDAGQANMFTTERFRRWLQRRLHRTAHLGGPKPYTEAL